MNSITNLLRKGKEYGFLLGILTLPVYQTINHWFFGLFMATSILLLFFDREAFSLLKKYKYLVLLISSFFFLKVFGLLNASPFKYGQKEMVRALPFLLYSIGILTFSFSKDEFRNFERKLFYALTIGCVITAVICWTNIILTLKPDDIPANQLFGWKKSGIYLTRILELHPPYLGMLIVASLLFLSKEMMFNKSVTKTNKYLIVFVCVFLFVFLFNITARNAMIFLVLSSIAFLIYTKRWKMLIIPVLAVIIANIIIINHPSKYYRIKMYDMLGLTKSDNVDGRFKRLSYSFQVFKSSPIYGVGSGNDNKLRIEEYSKNGDVVAAKRGLNAHNQFFEYLVAFGLIGGLLFVLVNTYFF